MNAPWGPRAAPRPDWTAKPRIGVACSAVKLLDYQTIAPGRAVGLLIVLKPATAAGTRGPASRHNKDGHHEETMWNQVYNPFANEALSTVIAAIPVATLLILIASGKVKAHVAAVVALIVAIVIAVAVFTMPTDLAIRASILGLVTGLFPTGWIVLNVIFLYRLTVEKGTFEILQQTIGGVTADRRLQLLLIAFSFGAFFEGASGFGTPVAVTGAILIGLGFSPLAASGPSFIANTAPLPYCPPRTPIARLPSSTRFDPFILGPMVGRQLPFF